MKEIEVEDLNKLNEYVLYKKLSSYAWNVLSSVDEENRHILGESFMKAIDSVGANIAEGFNQVDNSAKLTFYINSKAALSEAIDHWSSLMLCRNIISKVTYEGLKDKEQPLKNKLKRRISALIKSN